MKSIFLAQQSWADTVPGSCFLTGQFLNLFENNKNTKNAYKQVYHEFLESAATLPKLQEFPFSTPGTTLMICYGLFVFPKEWYGNKGINKINYQEFKKIIIQVAGEHLNKNIKDASELFTEGAEGKDEEAILRNLRHAVAHVNVDMEYKGSDYIYIFNGENSRNGGPFRIRSQELSVLLTAAGRYFSTLWTSLTPGISNHKNS